MAFALSTSASTSIALQSLFSSGSSHNHHWLKPPGLVLPRHALSRSTLAFSRRQNQDPAIKSSSSKKKKKSLPRKDEDDNDMEDDPFELLFSLLEEDLKNDDETDDEEINEEDIDKLAQELAEALEVNQDTGRNVREVEQ